MTLRLVLLVLLEAVYQDVKKRPDASGKGRWNVAMCPGMRRVLDKNQKSAVPIEQLEHLKASIRAEIEHPFRDIKRQF